jgi:hypothetical protein
MVIAGFDSLHIQSGFIALYNKETIESNHIKMEGFTMMKWKARKETMNIGELELGSLTFNEDYMEVSIDICDMSDSLKTEVNRAIELRKVESAKEWDEVYKAHPELAMYDRKWSSSPAVTDYAYLRIILEGGKAITYSIEAGFHDAIDDHLEECASIAVDLSEHTNELKKAVIKVLLDRFF